MDKTTQQDRNRQLMVCEHGIEGFCWWCQSLKNKPTETQINILKDRFDALLLVVKMLIKNMIMQKQGGNSQTIGIISQVVGSTLIRSGSDSSKPTDGGNLAFYYATDSDVIYQRRGNEWIDISFSKPTAPDTRVTDISIDNDTGSVEVTTV